MAEGKEMNEEEGRRKSAAGAAIFKSRFLGGFRASLGKRVRVSGLFLACSFFWWGFSLLGHGMAQFPTAPGKRYFKMPILFF